MYLISQLWWYLLLAFLLGALLGYLLWRACNRPLVESRYERSRSDLLQRVSHLEDERSKFTSVGLEAETDTDRLRRELAALKHAQDDANTKLSLAANAEGRAKAEAAEGAKKLAALQTETAKLKSDLATTHAAELKKAREEATASLAAAHGAEVKKLQETAKGHEAKVLALAQTDGSAKQELERAAARHADDLKKAREQVAAEWTQKHATDVKKARDDVTTSLAAAHAAELKRARDEAAAEAARKHVDDVKKARDEAAAQLSAAHAAEVKKLQETAKSHETRVLALTQTDSSAKQELESAKARHTDELKKTREQVAAEWTQKHAADVKKAREEAAAEAARMHADELKKASDKVTAEWAAKHKAELDKARTEAASAASAAHANALKSAREEAAAEAGRRHTEEVARLKREHDAALTRHAGELEAAKKTAQVAATTAKAVAAAKPTAPAKPDNLELIWGVGPEIAKLLSSHGVTRFEQVAAWKDKEVAWVDTLLPNFKGRAVSEKWVEQAQKLATGWRPEREIGDKPADILKGPRGGKADDLKLIWGVGPKLEQMLNKAGFYHFDQIATWTDKEITWVDMQLGEFAGRVVRDKWVEQCKKLATGWRPESDVGDKPD